MLQMILACYLEFEERVGMMSEKGVRSTAYDIVKAYMLDRIGKMTGTEVIADCPSVGRSAILGAIKKLTEEGLVLKLGSGRGTYYVRADAVQE